ncbi:MAG: PIN domain-containing protein [Candidatus Latescibacteria bacterium]|nr:PIN domain-containing protein [Candidatus Latescibacterota bacterium]
MIFVDTSAWIAMWNRKDENHQTALKFKDKITSSGRSLLTSNYVLDETYTLLLLNVGYKGTIEFRHHFEELRDLAAVAVYFVSEEVEAEAWEIFERFNLDKQWSFTDCTSKAIMEREGLTEAFAFDRHFDQMGFVRSP